MVLLVLVDTNFQHRLTDLHLSKLIMTVLTFRDASKFASVNPAIDYVHTKDMSFAFTENCFAAVLSEP